VRENFRKMRKTSVDHVIDNAILQARSAAPSSLTVRPDREVLAMLFNSGRNATSRWR
jgi:preprotein translocase subunit SecF